MPVLNAFNRSVCREEAMNKALSIGSLGVRMSPPLCGFAALVALMAGNWAFLWLHTSSTVFAAVAFVLALVAGLLLYFSTCTGSIFLFDGEGTLWVVSRSSRPIQEVSKYKLGRDATMKVRPDRRHRNWVVLLLGLGEINSANVKELRLGRIHRSKVPEEWLKLIENT